MRDADPTHDFTTDHYREIVATIRRTHRRIHLLTHEYIWHPLGWHWSALLFAEANEKFQRMWRRAEASIELFGEGLHLRAQKDALFMERYRDPNGGA